LDLSSVGKHVLDVISAEVRSSHYISEMPYTWGPYLYSYMGRQIRPYTGQDLFVMFKGFSKDVLPQRIFNAYKDVESRQVPLEEMVGGTGLRHNNSICRITTEDFTIADAYIFPDRVLLYTISCIEAADTDKPGYVIAGVVTDDVAGEASSGHEYWLFAADALAQGPICKLGHPDLSNSTLFHTVYVPSEATKIWDKGEMDYHVPVRQDYPRDEVGRWDGVVLEAFEDVIWPYFDTTNPKATQRAEESARQLSQSRG
jgi:hypothetical protein